MDKILAQLKTVKKFPKTFAGRKDLCKFCKSILGVDFPEHGYGLSLYEATQMTRRKETADYFEKACHEGLKLALR